ncbi:MAG: helix-turn-helix domain-containing protein [Flavobacteriaceae bacterium]|nr:MAG: helix-turn-helix domain-containing protein [Flavobacteriaceae bacterium]
MNDLRLKEKREKLGLTQVELAQIFGVSSNTIQNWEGGAKIPKTKIDFVKEKIDEVFNRYRYDENSLSYKRVVKEESVSLQSGVPYYDVDFTASFLEVQNNQSIKPNSYIDHPFFKGCDYVVRASGQSMAKVISHGDAIGLIKLNNWIEFFPFGEIYAIVTNDGFRMIKVITKGETDNTYTLISKPTDNKKDEFPPQQINKESIMQIFKVQASSHLF